MKKKHAKFCRKRKPFGSETEASKCEKSHKHEAVKVAAGKQWSLLQTVFEAPTNLQKLWNLAETFLTYQGRSIQNFMPIGVQI